MNEHDIDLLVESLRGQFGVTHDIESRTVDAHRVHFRSGELRAIDGANIRRFIQNPGSHAQHFRESLAQFQRTDLRNYAIGNDIPFLVALGTREGGEGVFRTGNAMVVSAGRDTHREGVSGMDYLYRRARYFRQAGVRIEAVNPDELRDGRHDRRPARIPQGELLFAHMVKAAADERTFQTCVSAVLREHHREAEGPQVLSNLSRDSRRAWIALFFAGAGFGGRNVRTLITDCIREHVSIDLNNIFFNRTLNRDMHVVIARATALRARIMEICI